MFCRIWRDGTCYLLSKILSALPRSFDDNFNTSCHAECCPRTEFFSRANESGGFGIRSARPLTTTSVLKTKFFIPISSGEMGTTYGAKASANHLAPSSSFTSFGEATQWPTFLLRPPGYGVQVVWSLFPTASAVSRWAVSSNTEGERRLNLTSPLSGAYLVTDANEVFFLVMIFCINSTFTLSSFVKYCIVLLRSLMFQFSLFCKLLHIEGPVYFRIHCLNLGRELL